MMLLKTLSSFSLMTLVALSITGGTVSLTGCEPEGPAERVGKDIDRSAEEGKEALRPSGPAEKTGEKVDRAVDKLIK
jgi:hypothetical protein